MAENMKIYEAVRKVPHEATKPFDNGTFKGTDINPMWRIKTLTEQFGPCGIGWYYEVISERSETHLGTTMAIVDLNLYIKVDGEWSKPIYGTGGNALVKETSKGQKASDEGYKMALTDALSVACKALGIGADVYWQNDPTKYTSGANTQPQNGAKTGAQTNGSAKGGTTTPPEAENAPQSAKQGQTAGTQIVDGIDLMDDIAYNAALIQMCEGTGITWEQLNLISKRDLKVDVNQQGMDQRNKFYNTVKEHTEKLKGGKA